MNKLVCTNPKNYRLTEGQEYDVIKYEGENIFLINDNGKTVRYAKNLFEEIQEEVAVIPPPPPPVRTEQDLIDSIENDGEDTVFIDFNNQKVVIPNYLGILNNANDFSCGIKNIINIGGQTNVVFEMIEDSQEHSGEDLEDLASALIKHHIHNFIEIKSNEGFDAGIYLMSCNIGEGDNGLDEEIVEILDEFSDFNSEPEVNPNSGNEIKIWGFYKSSL